MPVKHPCMELEELMAVIGEAGQRMREINACEGAAGNISIYIGCPIDPCRIFPDEDTIELPLAVPELAGRGGILITGSGRRLHEIKRDPTANLGFVVVRKDGRTATIFTSPRRLFARPTSEFNSHLAIHYEQLKETGANFHAVIHAQPLYLTYLSHIRYYQDEQYLNRHLLRWQPELIVYLPNGIGYIPFLVPGSAELMAATIESMRMHRVVLWAKHGVIARSEQSLECAVDGIEYAETAARYEFLNLTNGEIAEGLTVGEINAIHLAHGNSR